MAKSKASPIPPGFRTLTPYIGVKGAAKAIEFYTLAFGAKEVPRTRQLTPDGKILHVRLKIGDSLIMLSDNYGPDDGNEPKGDSPVYLHIYSKDVDKLWKAAISAGAKAIMPLDNMFWGERYGHLLDPFGLRWSVSMRVNMSKKEKDTKLKESMTMFAKDEHPGKVS
jgi:PhnB protein